MSDPVETRVPAPRSMRAGDKIPAKLAGEFERPGYKVAVVKGSDPPMLLVKRAGKMKLKNDPGALAPHVDHPFSSQELKNIAAIASTFKP